MLGYCICCGEYKILNKKRLCSVCQKAFFYKRKDEEFRKNISEDIKKAIKDFSDWKKEVEKELRFDVVTINDNTRLV